MPSTSSDLAGPMAGGAEKPIMRACRILVTASGRVPSVELGAMFPLRELMQRGRCHVIYSDEAEVTPGHVAWADVIFFVRACSARGQAIAEAARAAGCKLVAYYDDDFLNLPEGTPSQAYYGSKGIRNLLFWFLRNVDLLCFCNPTLAGTYGEVSRRPASLLGVGVEEPDTNPEPHTSVRVLFAGSTDHAEFVNRICGETLRALAAEPGVELHCIGARPGFVDDLPVDYTPYLNGYADYRAFIAALAPDVCLAPLPEGKFFACKFYNKLLDYGSLGSAIVFSNVPPYRGVVIPGQTGLLVANTAQAWREETLTLVRDPALRARLAQGARDYVREHHSLACVGDSYAEALGPLLDYRAPEVAESACAIAQRGRFQEYLAEHGLARTLRRGMRKYLGL